MARVVAESLKGLEVAARALQRDAPFERIGSFPEDRRRNAAKRTRHEPALNQVC
jgi:hypothetical protein